MANNYGPFGQPGGVPPAEGGVDDADSLAVMGISEPDSSNGYGWFPQIKPGRYSLNNESDFRYQYARSQSVEFTVGENRQITRISLPTAFFMPDTFGKAPLQIKDSASRTYTSVHNAVRWGVPVPPTNTILASGFVDSRYLYDSQGNLAGMGPIPSDTLWWMPTFGAEIVAVHRSRNVRSYDVLADSDAQLLEVSTPDQLVDDRCYCHDPLTGIVYGRVPSQTLPQIPYGPGTNAMTYVSLAYAGDSDPSLGPLGLSAADQPYWQNYLTTNAAFFAASEGASGFAYYDPLRLEEVAVVETDNLIRLRRTDVIGTSDYGGLLKPSVMFMAPDGPLLCTTTSVQGNVIDAQLPDPSRGGSLSLLEYGTTVIVRYYVKNSFTLSAVTGGPLSTDGRITATIHILPDTTAVSGVATLTYESDPHGYNLTQVDPSTPNLNPLQSPVANGFLYLEDSNFPPSLPVSKSAVIRSGVTRPIYYGGSQGEIFTIKCALLTGAGIEIDGATPVLTISPGGAASVVETFPGSGIAGPDGLVRYRIKTQSANAFTLSLADSRALSTILAHKQFLPVSTTGTTSTPPGTRVTQPWEPSVFISLGENYRTVAQVVRQIVRVSILGPDGFPWSGTQSPAGVPSFTQTALITLTSNQSNFHDPSDNGLDLPLGSQVSVFYNGTSDLLLPEGVLQVGYTAVTGDTLQATLYIGDDRYLSFPLAIP